MHDGTVLKFRKTADEMKLMAAFISEMQRQGGEMIIQEEDEYFRIVLLGL
jgi:hypothetical protein